MGGEMRANECILLETTNRLIPIVGCIALPTNRAYIDSYSLLWSVLSSIWIYNEEATPENLISSILCPGFSNPNTLPYETSNGLYLAYRSFLLNINSNQRSKEIIKDRESRRKMTFTPSNYAMVQRTLFIILVYNGAIVQRNFISTKEFSMLIDILKMEKNTAQTEMSCFPQEIIPKLREEAAKAIAHFTFPEQRYINLRTEVLKNDCLAPLLEFVNEEKIRVHRELSPKDIQIHSHIASGGCGSIHKATYEGIPVAIKTFRGFSSEETKIEFYRELGVCSMLQHPNLITCFGAHTQLTEAEEERFIVLDLLKRGSLWDVLEKDQKHLTKELRLKMALDCAEGMAYLHTLGIIHRDLKSLNLMVTEDWGVQVIDFGTSRVVDTNFEMTNNLGSTYWMAPEIFQNAPYDASVDIYSFGIVLWELLTMKRPYENIKGWDIPLLVTRGDRPPIPLDCEWDEWIIKLLKACWHQKPNKRPPFTEIVEIIKKYIEDIPSEMEGSPPTRAHRQMGGSNWRKSYCAKTSTVDESTINFNISQDDMGRGKSLYEPPLSDTESKESRSRKKKLKRGDSVAGYSSDSSATKRVKSRRIRTSSPSPLVS